MAKLGEQRGCHPWPCRAAPRGLSLRASLPGLAREKLRGAAGTSEPGAALRQPGRPARICLPFAALPCAGQASAGEPRHCEWQSRDGQSYRAACPRWGDPDPPPHRRQPEGTEDLRRGICGDFSSAETFRWLPAVRTGAAAGGSSRLSGTGGAQGALLRPSSSPQLVFTPFPPRSLAPLCPGLAGGPPLLRFPAPRQALPEETRLRPAQGAGRARSAPVRRRKCFAMRALLCQVTLLLYLFF